jgi:hypothetical protein
MATSSSTPWGWATIRGWEVRLPNQLLIRGDVMALLRERVGRPRRPCLCPDRPVDAGSAGYRRLLTARVECVVDVALGCAGRRDRCHHSGQVAAPAAGEVSLPDGKPSAPAGNGQGDDAVDGAGGRDGSQSGWGGRPPSRPPPARPLYPPRSRRHQPRRASGCGAGER